MTDLADPISGPHEALQPPLPPDELIDRVTPGVSEDNAQAARDDFLESGRRSVRDVERALGVLDRRLGSYERILEFGCGCGRILRWLEPLAAGSDLHGTDIDEAAIAWCAEHLPFVDTRVNPHEPPMDYPDGYFDLVFNHSVLTHLDERHQDLWLSELKRITKPGGAVLLTVHGEQVFEDNERALAASGENPTPGREQLERDGILFVERDSYVGSVFPDFYHTTFHAPWYVFERWGAVFTIRGYLPRGSLSHQDLVVLERPLDDPPHPRPVHARPGGAAPTPASAEPLGAHDPAPLERVSAELARGVVPRSPSRFGAPGELARRAVLRALRPYTSLERGLDRDLAEAVAATDRRTEELERALDANAAIARMSPLVHDVLNRHSERIKRLDAELQAELERLSDRVERLEGSGGP